MKEKLIKLGLTEEDAGKVVDNFGSVIDGVYVPKTRLDEVISERDKANELVKERDNQLEKIKNSDENPETLKQTISDLQKKNKEDKEANDKALAAERKTNAIKIELIGKVHNPEVAMSLLKQEEIVMDGDKVKSGLKEQIEGLRKTDSYMFIPETDNSVNQGNNNSVVVKGANPKEGDSVPQGNLSKAELMAKDLAKNANNNIKKTTDSIYFGE